MNTPINSTPSVTREWTPKALVVAVSTLAVVIAASILWLASRIKHVEGAISSMPETGALYEPFAVEAGPHKLAAGAIPDPTGSGVTHITSGLRDNAAMHGTNAQFPISDGSDVSMQTMTLDCTISNTGTLTCTQGTGGGLDGFGSGGTVFTFLSNEIKIGPTVGNRARIANESATTTDGTTYVSVSFVVIDAGASIDIALECTAIDVDAGGSNGVDAGDFTSFGLGWDGVTTPGGTTRVYSQNAMNYSDGSVGVTVPLAPMGPEQSLDGSVAQATTWAAQALVADGGVWTQVRGPNTDTYHIRCKVDAIQQTN